MIEVFNDFMLSLQYLTNALFERMEFVDGLGIGWVLLSLIVVRIVVSYLYGRLA